MSLRSGSKRAWIGKQEWPQAMENGNKAGDDARDLVLWPQNGISMPRSRTLQVIWVALVPSLNGTSRGS